MIAPAAKQVLLLWTDPRERQALFKILCATGAAVEFGDMKSDGEFPLPDIRYRLVVLDYDSLKTNAHQMLGDIGKLAHPPAVLVVTSTRDKQDLIELLSHDVLTNVVAKNTDLNANELVVTVQKIIRNDIFGIEKYLTWGTAPTEEVVKSSADKGGVLERLEVFLQSIGCNRRLVGLARSVADEFVTNAVYNAPVDAAGKPKYASTARTQRVDLTDGEEVKLRYACDGKILAMSVADNFGRLERATVLHYLRKCFMKGDKQIDDKEGGAGLGLYYIFESLNNLVINVAPKKRTEMIGIMDISGTYREFAERPKSLNLFLQETGQ